MAGRFLIALAIAALLVACSGGGSERSVLAPPEPSATPRPYVPDEAPTPGPPTGRVTTQVSATCRLSVIDAEINAVYRVNVTGPNSTLRRVSLLLNNKMADESGDIYTTNFEKTVTLHVAPGANYSLIVTYAAPNAIGPQILNIVTCPAAPGQGA